MQFFGRIGLLSIAISIGSFAANAEVGTSYPKHRGDSPLSYDAIDIPGGDFNVTDYRPYTLDEYMYYDGYAYQIDVAIPNNRYVGDLAEAVANGALSENARIFIPAYDVDANTVPTGDCDWDGVPDTLYPEHNEVYLNGELLGVLDGDDGLWKFNSEFVVPIEKLRFPTHPGDTAINRVQVAIDVKNKNAVLSSGRVGCRIWATSIDWIGIKFDAADSFLFMTGLGGSTDSFENSGYPEYLRRELGINSKIVGHNTANGTLGCSNGELQSVRAHAENFILEAKKQAQLIGSADFHAIGHSMGGLDGRMALNMLTAGKYTAQVGTMDGQPISHELTIKSLLSHGSPHEGTVVADYFGTRGVSEVVADICDLETQTWELANQFLVSGGTPIATIGADADSNGDLYVDVNEVEGNQIPAEFKGVDTLQHANFLYRLIYENESVEWGTELATVHGIPMLVPVVVYEPSTPNPNDTMVSVRSANGVPNAVSETSLQGKNHGTILDTESQSQALHIGKSTLGWGAK